MREIKFRAWDPACDHMIYSDCTEEDYWWRIGEDGISIEWYDPCIVKLTPDGPVETDGWVEISNSVVMEYTGNKDKNGKEIYEGDVVIYPQYYFNDRLMSSGMEVIEWEGPGFNEVLWAGHGNYPAYVEVVGNIYENPELLKEAKE